jgi:DNA repair protein SbcD/Mre11
MNVLHTADWHLGRKLYEKDFLEEQQQFLNWLLTQATNEQIDVLVVAGDIFDTNNPPNEARRMYYDFLSRLVATPCREIVLIGGNHDAPSMLEVSKELLELFKIRVVGGTTDSIADEIVEIRNPQGQVEMLVAAVPFLRDKDVNYSRLGEDAAQREARVKEAIRRHYQALADLIDQRIAQGLYPNDIPIIATGHLFAQGVKTSESEKEIYVGNLGQIGANEFPTLFSYVALGHLHRPQTVGNAAHIRYSGSPIPLSFSEISDKKVVLKVSFEGRNLAAVEKIAVPSYRTLLRWAGTLEEVKQQIAAQTPTEKESWAEVVLHLERPQPNAQQEIQDCIQKHKLNAVLLRVITKYKQSYLDEQGLSPYKSLTETTERDIFIEKCKQDGKNQQEIEMLLPLFEEICNQLNP